MSQFIDVTVKTKNHEHIIKHFVNLKSDLAPLSDESHKKKFFSLKKCQI